MSCAGPQNVLVMNKSKAGLPTRLHAQHCIPFGLCAVFCARSDKQQQQSVPHPLENRRRGHRDRQDKMIKQRPISPSLPTTATNAATSSNGSRFASLRRAVQGRPSSSASARTVCLLLAALCLVLFVAEMKEAPSSIHTSGAAQNSASSEPDPDSAPAPSTAVVVVKDQEHEEEPQEQAEEVENMPPAAFPGGLRRFESFEEFVVSPRRGCVRMFRAPAIALLRPGPLCLFSFSGPTLI